ncbi:MAG TPA: aminoglycoside phosphotransferase family protein [Caulobacteraceae bacterium]|nr:aminoglycoside phosphotransferase family protein [Caulobacteraceae bacterium]
MSDPEPLAALREAILDRFPHLADETFDLSPHGWDSLAVDVGGRLIFKFPRHEAALGRLRKEAAILAAIRPQVAMPVPDLTLIETGPRPFSRHDKLVGDDLTPEAYAALSEAGKDRVGEQLARFYADLHALDPAPLRALGVGPIGPWLGPEAIARVALPLLPGALRGPAEAAIAAWADLPPDPHGETWGFFDGHGWNMAFDAAAERLNGVYDFGDSGFGALHQEFIYSNLVSFDLTERIAAAYERLACRDLDRARIHLLTGIHALSEFAENAPDHVEAGIARIGRWAAAGKVQR